MIPSIFYSNNYSFTDEIESIFRNNWIFFGFKSEFNDFNIVDKIIGNLPVILVKLANSYLFIH